MANVRGRVLCGVLLSTLLVVSARAGEPAGDAEDLLDRERWFHDKRLGSDGEMPVDGRNRALSQLDENVRSGLLADPKATLIAGEKWTPVGPSPLHYDIYTFSGRVTALAVHPTNPNLVYVGTAQGGVWRTTDHGATWTPLTDSQKSLAIGSLALDPSNPSVIYAGTGEANSSCDSYFGAGILKSTDGGTNWTLIGASPFASTSVSRIVVSPTNPNVLWAANASGVGGFVCSSAPAPGSIGVWKSTNGGTSWTLVLAGATHDLAVDPSNSNVLYAGVDFSGIWKSTDGGASWNRLTGGLPSPGAISRVAFALDPNTPATLYAIFGDSSNGRQYGGFKSTNGGASWSSMPKPAGSCYFANLLDVCTYASQPIAQCWYDLVVGVAPDGGVWIGGVGVWRSGNGGASWTSVCPSAVHVDQHALAFRGSDVWLGNDGGVFNTRDNGATWTSRNPGLFLTQFYPGAAVHPANRSIAIGGTQDNGVVQTMGSTNWNEILAFADGGFCAYDYTNPDGVYYISTQYLNIYKWDQAVLSSAITGLADALSGNSVFIAPFTMCPNNPQVLIAGSDNVWLTTDGAGTWTSNSPDPIDPAGTSRITAMAFAKSTGDCSTYFAGTGSGRLYRTTSGGGGWSDVSAGLPARGVNEIAVDPGNAAVVVVALSGFGSRHLWRSTNALDPAPAWAAIDPGIPDTPVNAILFDPGSSSVIYIGTDVGIFRSIDSGASWSVFMDGHPNVAVFALEAAAASGTIMSFTHGRGAFRLEPSCSDGDPCTQDTYDPTLGCQHAPLNCADQNACTDDACDPALGCVHTYNSGPCDDGNACTTGDTCNGGGVCTPGGPTICADNNDCTTDQCFPATGCAFVSNTNPCNDGNACTVNDRCNLGVCSGTVIVCNDGNPCTDDACNPATGCVFANNSAPCNDGNLCTANDTCGGGTCHGTAVVCNDANPCTDDTCNPATGCVYASNATTTCDDGNPCTTGETCGPEFSERFDGVTAPALPAGWTATVDGAGSPWATRAVDPDTAPNSAFGADSAGTTDDVLDTPPIAISSSAAKLTFRTRWSYDDAANCFDAGVLEIKIGAAAYADIVTAGGSFIGGGYTGTVDVGYTNPLAARPAWCFESPGYPAYITTTVSLPPSAAGQTIKLRWRIGSDSSAASVGQDVDSIAIEDPVNTCRGGVPVAAPSETQNLSVAADKRTYAWSPAVNATRYDVVRGSLGALPVGPGAGDEMCFDDLAGATLSDSSLPPPGAGFWYLSRGENDCGIGSYGVRSGGAPRVTTTCP